MKWYRIADKGTEYGLAGAYVDGRLVHPHVPNMSSIESSILNPEELPGIREVPMSAFTLDETPSSKDPRTIRLAEEIKQSGEINPLIVGIDREGPYIIEGGHRYDALKLLGAKSFPAVVVIDRDEVPAGQV
jgi:hypothetical protein